MKPLRKLWTGGGDRKSRFHDGKGNLLDLGGLAYLPRSLATMVLRRGFRWRPAVPWLGYRGVRRVRGLIRPDWAVLEFGSGMSTIWFARRCRSVVSIEDNPSWFEKVSAELLERRVGNVRYEFRAGDDYHQIDDCEDGSFDLVLVDGSRRDKCAAVALSKVKPGGWIYLDNSDQFAHDPDGETRVAENVLLEAVGRQGGQVEYFVDLIPGYVHVTQGMLVRIGKRPGVVPTQ